MAIKQIQNKQKHRLLNKRGFALLIAIIFMSVMLTFGLQLGSLSYKQVTLSAVAENSGYAFYAADAASECALYADQQLDTFNFSAYSAPSPTMPPPSTLISCGDAGDTATKIGYSYSGATELIYTQRLSLGGGKYCADITIYKPSPTFLVGGSPAKTYIFSQGYNIPCTEVGDPNVRVVSRGLFSEY